MSLTYLGANYNMLSKSARKQITWYFSLPIVVAAISAIFSVRGLFMGAVTTNMKAHTGKMMGISIIIIMFI